MLDDKNKYKSEWKSRMHNDGPIMRTPGRPNESLGPMTIGLISMHGASQRRRKGHLNIICK